MMTNLYHSMVGFGVIGQGMSSWSLWILPVLAWSVIWKGIALWKSARCGSKVWFVVLLVVNTVGILEILYLYVFSKKARPVENK